MCYNISKHKTAPLYHLSPTTVEIQEVVCNHFLRGMIAVLVCSCFVTWRDYYNRRSQFPSGRTTRYKLTKVYTVITLTWFETTSWSTNPCPRAYPRLVVICENSHFLEANIIVDDQYICDSNSIVSCDHRGITSLINSTQPPKKQKTVSIRKYRNIDVGDFEKDIASFLKTTSELGLDGIVDLYHKGVKAIIEKHAPTQTKTITIQQNTK